MPLSPEHKRADEEQEDQRSREIADEPGAVDRHVGDNGRQGGAEGQPDAPKRVHLALPDLVVERHAIARRGNAGVTGPPSHGMRTIFPAM